MTTTIVYLDDADHAVQQIAPLRGHTGGHWILVGCAPRMTHRISKWVSHSARENWRSKWADKLFGQIAPWLQAQGDTVTPLLATGPLAELTDKLLAEHHGARVLDQNLPAPRQATDNKPRWHLPGTTMALLGGILLAAD
jgi:hypothetical protein